MYINDHRALEMHGVNVRTLLWVYVRPQETADVSSYVSPELTLTYLLHGAESFLRS